MTMPHLMNCAHSEEGWCLECVKREWERHEKQVDRIEMIVKVILEANHYETQRITDTLDSIFRST